jgi:hypothetical protein
METFRKEMRSQQKRGWTSNLNLPSWSSWPSSPSTFASWQRSVKSFFSPRSSYVAWPWRPKSRWRHFWRVSRCLHVGRAGFRLGALTGFLSGLLGYRVKRRRLWIGIFGHS